MLGLQEIPQLRQFYKKEVADTISAIIGNVLSGAVRDKNTLDWLEKCLVKLSKNPTLNLFLIKEQPRVSMKKWTI